VCNTRFRSGRVGRKPVREQHRTRCSALKAPGPLAVAVTDILVRFAHSNRADAGDYTSASAPRPFDPPGTATAQHRPQATHLPNRLRSSLTSFAPVLIHRKTNGVSLPSLRSLRSRRPRAAPPRDETLGGARHHNGNYTSCSHSASIAANASSTSSPVVATMSAHSSSSGAIPTRRAMRMIETW